MVWAALIPSSTMRKNEPHASFLACAGVLAIFGIPWLLSASPQSLPSSSDLCLACVCPSPFDKDSSHAGLGTTLLLSSLLDYLHLWWSYFHMRDVLSYLRWGCQHMNFGELYSAHNQQWTLAQIYIKWNWFSKSLQECTSDLYFYHHFVGVPCSWLLELFYKCV